MQEITFDSLLKKAEISIKNTESLKNIKKAYDYIDKVYNSLDRNEKETKINRAIGVSLIVLDLNADEKTIIASLIQDAYENNYEEIKNIFGEEIAGITEALSKINKLELTDDSESAAIYLRNVLVGMSLDVRVLYIKLSDTLYDMRLANFSSEEEKRKKSNEALNVLVPIAHRLGINSIKSELENLSLKYLKPDVYNDILEKINASSEELNRLLIEMKESLASILSDNGITFEIKYRVKSVYSIYNKLSKGREWSDIYDLLALRIIVDKVSDCYLAVGLIHAKYRPIPKRFKDFIAMPKENMYQSLHTTVFGVEGQLFEIQLRTYEMDEIAEKGIASHVSYKEKGSKKVHNIMEQKLEMFRNIIETNENDSEIDDALNTEVLNEYIYVFTPKGDVVELPKGATPIDFAYRIHSKVGDKMVGALVNDKIVPLTYELKDNDIVKINTSNSATPNKDWLGIVKTAQAKNKIKSYFSKKDRETYTIRGKEILEKELRKRKLSINEVLSDDNINKIIKELKLKDIDDIYFSVGSLRYTAGFIINTIIDDKPNASDALLDKISNIQTKKINHKSDILVSGIDDIMVNLAKCCKPIKGDNIVGFITKGEGITIHRNDCKNIINETTRLIDVSWNNNSDSLYSTNLYIKVLIGKNYLTEILNKATILNIIIESFKTDEYPDCLVYELVIRVKDIDLLDKYIKSLEMLDYVTKVSKNRF